MINKVHKAEPVIEASTGFSGYFVDHEYCSGAGIGSGYTGYECKSSGAGLYLDSGYCKHWGKGSGCGTGMSGGFGNGRGEG